jgi:radical SAM protein with 4Fe4S-binding SPASM domain
MESGEVNLKSFPQTVMIDMSSVCNFNCKMCLRTLNPKIYSKIPAFPSKKVIQEFMNILPYVNEVYLYRSGEPFLNKELLPLARRAEKCYANAVITTSGSLLDDRKIEFLIKNKIYVLRLSIDGTIAKTYNNIRIGGDFDELMLKIDKVNYYKMKYKSDYPQLRWHFVAMKQNIYELPDAIKLAHDKKFELFECSFMVVQRSTKLETQSLYHYKEKTNRILAKAKKVAEDIGMKVSLPELFNNKKPVSPNDWAVACKQAWRSAVIRTNGDVVPCCGSGQNLSLGNLNNSSFREIWNGNEFLKLRRGLLAGNPPDYCLNCTSYKTLYGGVVDEL